MRTANGPLRESTRASGPFSLKNEVSLQRPWFIVSWLVIVIVHLACGIYSVLNGYLHLYLTTSRMAYITGYIADKDPQHFKRAAIMYIMVGALHLTRFVIIIVVSMKNCALTFRSKPSNLKTETIATVWGPVRQFATGFTVIDRFVNTVNRQGLLESQGGFTMMFMVQESIVVMSQTYQANRCCTVVTRAWINSLYVVLVIANCWLVPLLCIYLRHQAPAVIRIVLLGVDTTLNMGSCFIFPFIIFWSYYQVFDMTTYDFPEEMRYDSTWQSRLLTEMQMIFALSLPDLISRMLNHVSIFTSLVGVASLVTQQKQRDRPIRMPIASASLRPLTPTTKIPSLTKQYYTPRWVSALQILLVSWGLSLLVIYGIAVNRTSTPLDGCIGMARPWFSTRYSCSIFKFNCYRQQVASPKGSNLAVLDPKTLLFLNFEHCPDMKVPSEIQTFPNLLGFHAHNSTISEWSAASAILATKHPHLTAVAITRCNMSSFPDGLMQPLPAMLSTMVFSHTNLKTLPKDLQDHWKPILHLMVVNSELEEIPEAIFQLDIKLFSFVGNRIRHLSSFDPIHKMIPFIDMGMNPLQDLPSTIGKGAFIGLLNVEDSNISSFPPWFGTNLGLGAASGSPYCTLPIDQRSTLNVICNPMNPNAIGRLNITRLDAEMPL